MKKKKNQNIIENKIKKNRSIQISNDTFVKFLVILSFDLFHGLQTAIQLLSQATYPRERSRNICQDKRSVFSSPKRRDVLNPRGNNEATSRNGELNIISKNLYETKRDEIGSRSFPS